ncbi:hypothetical protein BJY01DRAFT_219117 [Aspergillus pseudoustus]|uniref:Bacteriophage T5 Orf172 DNA-binding domain-containing protein n=1 Tax=Aspergillus pseudoustus TaxID=1810923 RepID=A0ABR4JHZ2_9EURO
MPAKPRRFVQFCLLSPSHPEFTAKCSAHKNDGDPCTSSVWRKGLASKLETLHARAQESTADEKTIEDTLRELARLTICGYQQRSYGAIEAAVQQWRSELLAQDNATIHPNTPENAAIETNENERSDKLIFTPFETPDVDILLSRELDRIMDRTISRKINNCNWKDKRDHLYIFACEEAEGMCKLGRTLDLSRRASQHEKCYPHLVERWSLYCPNAKVFERVVQLEFSQRRYQHKCPKCKVTHTEWFKADLEGMYQRVKTWCKFSCGLEKDERRQQLTIPLAGFSSDPDRWYTWAQKWLHKWDEEKSQSEPKTPVMSAVDSDIVTGDNLNIDDDAQSVPGLSPSCSTPGTLEDDYDGPPTPTPVVRPRKERSRPRVVIPTTSEPELPEVFLTPVETMVTPQDRVPFPVIPGAFPASPLKAVPEAINDNGDELDHIVESIRLLL